MLRISRQVGVPLNEIEMTAMPSQGAGGQNVNKVATAIQVRFDIQASSLPDFYKERLLKFRDHRITKEGVVILKAQRYRTQEKNREDALNRLRELIQSAGTIQRKRKPTRPGQAAREKRLQKKSQRSRIKSLRGKVTDS